MTIDLEEVKKDFVNDIGLKYNAKSLVLYLIGEIERLQAENAELREVVKALIKTEWYETGDVITGEESPYDVCYLCNNWRRNGHAPDCPHQRAKALIEEAKE